MLSSGISAICSQYSGHGYHVGSDIPARKLSNAAKSMKIPDGEQVIAFVDCTVFGSGKHGLAICDSGLYWHNDWTTETATNHLSWETFMNVEVGYARKHTLGLGPENFLNTAASALKPDDLVRLLKEIQEYVRQAHAPIQVFETSGTEADGAESHNLADGIYEACLGHFGDDYYVGRAIPRQKLDSAAVSMNIPRDEQIMAFIDCSVTDGDQNGMAIGTRGVYWRNPSHTPTAVNFLSWEAFRDAEMESFGKYEIRFGEGAVFTAAGSDFTREEVVLLLRDLQAYLRGEYDPFEEEIWDDEEEEDEDEEDAELPPPPPRASRWYLAIDGQQYGPYGMNTLRELVQSGQVVPESTFAWKQGMVDWVPFTQVPELSALLGGSATPPSPPPLPPGNDRAAPSAGHPSRNVSAESETRLVDINTASGKELIEILGLLPDQAARIIREREAIGGFTSPEQVGALLGLKPHEVVRLRRSVRFSPFPKHVGRGRMVDF